MSNFKRNGIIPLQVSKVVVALGLGHWRVVMLAVVVALFGAAYLQLPQRQAANAVPTAPTLISSPSSGLSRQVPASKTRIHVAASALPTPRPAVSIRNGDTDIALQNLWRICAEPKPADIKVIALDRYARTLFAIAGAAANDALERIANAAFDYDPAMARVAALHSSVPEIRLAALANLAHGTDVQAPATLALVATDPDVDVRRGAIEGLGLLIKNDPQVRFSLAYLKQAETDPYNAKLIEDWLASITATVVAR